MDHDVHRSQPVTISEAAKDLANAPFEAMPYDGIADFTAGGDTEPNILTFVGMEME